MRKGGRRRLICDKCGKHRAVTKEFLNENWCLKCAPYDPDNGMDPTNAEVDNV